MRLVSVLLSYSSLFSPNYGVALVASLAVGMTSIIFTTASTTFLQVSVDPEVRGRVLSFQMVLTVGSVPIGGIIMGWLADHMEEEFHWL